VLGVMRGRVSGGGWVGLSLKRRHEKSVEIVSSRQGRLIGKKRENGSNLNGEERGGC